MLDILTARLVKWTLIVGFTFVFAHVYGLSTGQIELISPIAQSTTTTTQECTVDVPQWALDTPTILPEYADPETTPVTLLDGTYVPEESPEGGYPIGWADNSPVYSDGWMLKLNDTLHITRWIAPH